MRSLDSKQQGATLIIALSVLMVITIIGVSMSKSGIIQERMSSNNQQKSLANNAAEYALRSAEKWLLDNIKSTSDLSIFDGTNGYYAALPLPNNKPDKPLDSSVNLSKSTYWKAEGIEVAGLSKKATAKAPRYIIEYIGRGQTNDGATKVNVLNAGSNSGDISPFYFRITAIGWSRNENIYSVLESTFRTGYGDNIFTY